MCLLQKGVKTVVHLVALFNPEFLGKSATLAPYCTGAELVLTSSWDKVTISAVSGIQNGCHIAQIMYMGSTSPLEY